MYRPHGASAPICAALSLALLLAGVATAPAAGVEGYMLYPDHNGERLVFAAEGDLWGVAIAGGQATRLTSHPASELFPQFSPDGRWIAFSAAYAGPRDIYIMPAEGGEPRRLTFGPEPEETVGWTPDGARVLFRMRSGPGNRAWIVKAVPVDGGLPETFPVGMASLLSVHKDGETVAFNRFGSFRFTWKRYGGGTNDNLWLGNTRTGTFKEVTTFHGTDSFPMWAGDRVFFLSDRDGKMNIWSLDRVGGDLRQHTRHADADARWPNIHGDAIVYHLMGDIWRFDTATGKDAKIPITLATDRQRTFEQYPEPMEFIEEVFPSHDGKRLVFATRGNLFTMGPKRGPVATIADDSATRDRHPAFSPDGEWIAAWSSIEGEEELVLYPADGDGDVRQLTRGSTEYHHYPRWSPDGSMIAFADNKFRVRIIDVESAEITEVDQSDVWETDDYAWSPDSRFLAYSFSNEASIRSIYIHDTTDGTNQRVTSELFDCAEPRFDASGEYLFFLSRRTINPFIDDFDFETISIESTLPYFIILAADGDSFLTPPELRDEGEEDEDEDKDSDDKNGDDEDSDDDKDADAEDDSDGDEDDEDDDEDEEEVVVTIDFDGIEERTYALPVEPANYDRLFAGDEKVFFRSVPTMGLADEGDFFGDDDTPKNSIIAFDFEAEKFEDRKGEVFIAGVSDFDLSGDGEKLLYLAGKDVYVVGTDSKPGDDLDDKKVDTSRLSLSIDPKLEWAQIFHDAYLFQREFYYAETMAGVDWNAIYKQYGALLPRIATRGELNDLIGQLIAELGTGHTYVWGGGDAGPPVKSPSVGTLGADLAWDAAAGAYAIVKIYRGYPWNGLVSPLSEPQARVDEGEFLHRIDGHTLAAGVDPHRYLTDRAGKPVSLRVSADGTDATARDIYVTPMGSDAELRYVDWVEANRRYVDEKSGGRLGYIHIPDMGGDGMVMFYRYFYPQAKKDGLLIDARFNGGGFVSQLIIGRLTRSVIAYGMARNSKVDGTYPDRVMAGPKVVLTNENAGSDGDIFPEAFQLKQLGPVIGMRSWGGVVGIRGDKRFVDGGLTTQPEFAWWDTRRGWALENEGVYPDIVVPLNPEDELAGRDPQLDKGIEVLMGELEKNAEKFRRPARPPFPNTIENWKRRGEPFMTKP